MSGKMQHCDSQKDITDNKGTQGNLFPASPCCYGASPGSPGDGGLRWLSLLYYYQGVFLQHGLARLYADGRNLTIGLGLDVVGHLHGFQHH